MTNAGSNRILDRGRSEGETPGTLCAGCHNVLKRANLQAGRNAIKQEQINEFNEEKYEGGLSVLHFLEILRDRVGFGTVRDMVNLPLHGLPVGAYYGCLLLRPFDEMRLDDPHRPSVLEDLLVSTGCTPVEYPSRTECCGSYLGVGSPDSMTLLSRNVVQSARSSGATILAVSCPLCKYNLEASQKQDLAASSGSQPLQVVYFTQLLGLALGAAPQSLRLNPVQIQAIRGRVQAPPQSVNQP